MLAIRTILCPTDYSEHSDHAFHLAFALARDYRAKLVVLHVAEAPLAIQAEGLVVPGPPPDLDRMRQRLKRHQAPDVSVQHRMVEGGDPMNAILDVANEVKPDLNVIGTHGRTGLSRLLMGSVAEAVVRRAPCPVLTVKTPFPESVPTTEAEPTAISEPALALQTFAG